MIYSTLFYALYSGQLFTLVQLYCILIVIISRIQWIITSREVTIHSNNIVYYSFFKCARYECIQVNSDRLFIINPSETFMCIDVKLYTAIYLARFSWRPLQNYQKLFSWCYTDGDVMSRLNSPNHTLVCYPSVKLYLCSYFI